MDFAFLNNAESFDTFPMLNSKFSFSNNDFFVCKEWTIENFNKFEEFDELLKKEEKPITFNITIDNSKELKLFKDAKNKKEEDIIVDKNHVEAIQLKVKENIYSKRPFKEKKLLGRKKKAYEGLGEHNKFSNDNIIRKVKHVILHNIMVFINKKIKSLYSYDDEKVIKERQLFKLKQNQPMSSRIDYNKDFLEKTLGKIFSEDISSKYSCHPSTHNKKLIESLINDKDEKKRNIFINIFNLTFLDCLKHFRGSEKIVELDGINNLEDYLKNQIINDDENYCTIFKYFINNFETIIKEKKSRIRNKKKVKTIESRKK